MESVARKILETIGEHYGENTDDTGDLHMEGYRALAEAFFGKALLKEGDHLNAHRWLSKARDSFASLEVEWSWDIAPRSVNWVWKLNYWRSWEVAENLALVRQQTGNHSGALDSLEWAFAQNDQWVQDNEGLLASRLRTARIVWELIRLLDPENSTQAVRRLELLKRAEELLDDPDNESRFSSEELQIKQRIHEILYGPSFPVTPPAKSIAILPFRHSGGKENDRFFTDGIHDSLLTEMAGIREITTISRTSVMGYRGTTKTAKEIGKELGVGGIVEGSVHLAGNQIRINANLVNTMNDALLWAQKYNRQYTAESVFAILDEISLAIAQALQATLSPEEKKRIDKLPTENVAALEAYYKGKNQPNTREGAEAAVKDLERAIALDPNFAWAYTELARQQFAVHVKSGGVPELREKCEQNILKALDLDNASGEAYRALSFLRERRGDLQGAIDASRKAIDLNPNDAIAYKELGELIKSRQTPGYKEEAAQLYRMSYELDPKNQETRFLLGSSLLLAGQREEALKLREIDALENPTDGWAHARLAALYEGFGRFDDAIIARRKKVALDGGVWTFKGMSWTYWHMGDRNSALWWYDKF